MRRAAQKLYKNAAAFVLFARSCSALRLRTANTVAAAGVPPKWTCCVIVCVSDDRATWGCGGGMGTQRHMVLGLFTIVVHDEQVLMRVRCPVHVPCSHNAASTNRPPSLLATAWLQHCQHCWLWQASVQAHADSAANEHRLRARGHVRAWLAVVHNLRCTIWLPRVQQVHLCASLADGCDREILAVACEANVGVEALCLLRTKFVVL